MKIIESFFPPLLRMALGLSLVAGLLTSGATLKAADDTGDRRASAQGQFARAEQMRAALEAKPERQRSLQDYQQMITAYRRVYLITPNAAVVPQSLKNVGDFYRKMGDQFERSYFDSAVEAYEFLIHEYPSSRYREDAMLAIADIQRMNLAEPNLAEQAYEDFLKQFPHSPRAADATKSLALLRGDQQLDARLDASADARADARAKSAPAPAPASRTLPVASPSAPADASPTGAQNAPAAGNAEAAPDRTSGLKHIRVWNAETYTRVIIDLGGQAKYRSARISNPDRIYFDIENAGLSGALLHQPIELPKGGYLKSVRVAQNKIDTVRVVLEVTQVKDYSVFELPNPDRLVVDVYGPNATVTHAPLVTASASPAAEPAATPLTQALPVASAAIKPIRGDSDSAPVKTASSPKAASRDAAAVSAAVAAPITAPNAPITKSKAVSASAGAAKASTASARANSVSATESANTITPAAITASNAAPSDSLPVNSTSKALGPKSRRNSPFTPVNLESEPLSPRGSPRAADIPPAEPAKKAAMDLGPASEAEPNHSGTRTLTRALGLKIGRIVIDAGHGGRDTGTIGPTGLMEKDVCLDVALRMGKLIHERLPSAEVVYTRDDDSYVGLEQRTTLANDARADLFVSIHANSSQDHRISGIETYYLNLNTSADAMKVASRENASAQGSVHDLQDLVGKIARNDKIEESRDLAQDVQDSLAKRTASAGIQERDRGVRKAPFVVLIGANMPSVLSEISFLSNPSDEQWLKLPENREHIAEGLYHGIEAYLRSTNSLGSDSAPAPIATDRSTSNARSSDPQ